MKLNLENLPKNSLSHPSRKTLETSLFSCLIKYFDCDAGAMKLVMVHLSFLILAGEYAILFFAYSLITSQYLTADLGL